VLALVGVLIHLIGAATLRRVLPPVVSGAVVMLIGFNLAPVVAGTYWPQDQGVAILTMLFAIVAAVAFRGFWSRIAVFLALIFGYVLSFVLDRTAGVITSKTGAGEVTTHFRIDWSGVSGAHWFGLPTFHSPEFHFNFILLALPGVIALIAENTGHVRAVAEMTGDNLDPYMGRAIFADGLGTALASAVGGSPTTTYAENIGVMAATKVYSTAAYYVAAVVAIVLGLVPKFGAIVNATPGGVLGGITVVLYGMIGLLGAKIWVENRVNFANSINLVPIAAGLIAGIGGVTMAFGSSFSLSGIALGSIVAIVGFHLARVLAPPALQHTLYLPDPAATAPARTGRVTGPKVTASGQPGKRGPARQRR
jgi:uracil-xanthine permease